MSYSSGLITAPVKSDTAGGDIQLALGTSSGNLGTLCTNRNINMFSKYKPNELTGYDQPSDSALASNRYSVAAIATSSRGSLATMSLAWTYHKAQAPYFRQLDFNRYYNAAPIPFMQANGATLTVDLVNQSTAPALFYMLMNAGALANKPFSTASGIGSSGTAVPSNRLDYCIAVEDLGFDSGGGSYKSIMGAYLGLVIFQGTTFKADVWASTAVAELSSRDNNMFIVPLSGLNLAMGDYTAVACAKQGNYYLPVYDDANYPARFTLTVGGLDLYSQSAYGLATTNTASTATMIRTTGSDAYVTMRFYNNSGRTLDITGGSNQKFTLKVEITGSVVSQGTTVSIDRTVANGKAYITASMATPSSGTISVADGSYAELVFLVPRIWSTDGTTLPVAIESGEVSLKPRLFFNGATEYTANLHRALTVRYGS
jgi:hypothetical protein